MAQLRDKKTSQIIFEGTPLEAAKLAEKIGTDEVLFDDVGTNFDHKVVLASHDEQVSVFRDMTKSKDKDLKKTAEAQLKNLDELKKRLTAAQKEAEAGLKDARANLK